MTTITPEGEKNRRKAMTGFDLFKEMDSFTREMDQVFRDLGFGRPLVPGSAYRGFPRINLRENQDVYILEAQLPGIDPKELEMTLLKGTLTLSGERKASAEEQGTWHRRERGCGKFMRCIDIPAEIDGDKVRADYKDGLLTVTLAKAVSVLPKRIEIQAD
jgi:HSP20 family protein